MIGAWCMRGLAGHSWDDEDAKRASNARTDVSFIEDPKKRRRKIAEDKRILMNRVRDSSPAVRDKFFVAPHPDFQAFSGLAHILRRAEFLLLGKQKHHANWRALHAVCVRPKPHELHFNESRWRVRPQF